MSCTKIRFLQLTLLFALALNSCKKESLKNFQENNPSSPSELPYPEINIQTTKILPSSSISNEQIVLDMEEAIRDLALKSLVQTAFHPEVYGLTGNSASTRTGCPCSTLETASGPSGSVYTITLDYGTGCGTVSTANYEGIVTLTINGELNTNGTVLFIQLDNDFKINSVNDMDGDMTFTYEDDGTEQKYNIDDISLQNTNTTNMAVTAVSLVTPALNGQFTVKPNTVGDPGNALDIVNDTIAYNGCIMVHCPNTQTLRACSTDEIFYSIPCGAPFDGELVLDSQNPDGSYGAGNPLSGTFGNMEFAYPQATSFGECDNLVEFTDNVANTTTIINL